MKKQLITFVLSLTTLIAAAQEAFIVKGKIEFEKKTNLHRQLEIAEEDDAFVSTIKKTMPQYKTTYFDLYFNNTKTVYQPGKEVVSAQKVPDWFEGPATDNIVFTDLGQKNFSSKKTVYENVFNIQDSVRKMDWKITADTRTIAGIECRKATTIIMDSVFVVAFYADEIVTPGGPESFSGLPGMILGLAIPRLHTTWFATKVELIDVKETTLIPPKKGKKTTINELKSLLKSSMKNWGKWGDKNTWQIMI